MLSFFGFRKYSKTIICFANSRKNAGRCIAGKEWQNDTSGEWIRPVSTCPTHEISKTERRYRNAGEPQLLDILCVPCKIPQPLSHQRENHVIAAKFFWFNYWKKHGRLTWENIYSHLDTPVHLWIIGQSSYRGINNRVNIGQENGTSLYLIAVDSLLLLVGHKVSYSNSKRTIRGEFIYQGVTYRMDVTDPVIERQFLSQNDGEYTILNPVLCISLGDPYEGYFYKLIAGVLYKERFKNEDIYYRIYQKMRRGIFHLFKPT